jgi:hypothetical protein
VGARLFTYLGLAAAASARWWRRLVPCATVVAARTASAVTERGADGRGERQSCKDAREELTLREFHLPASLPPRIRHAAAGTCERKMRLDTSSMVESSPIADRSSEPISGSAGGIVVCTCDFCGARCEKWLRRRLMWATEADGQLVLADLCPRCASHADRLLRTYGGRGRESLRVTGPGTPNAIGFTFLRKTSGAVMRGAVYVLIALVTFLIVTLITARH